MPVARSGIARTVLAALLVAAFVLVLLVNGLCSSVIGRDSRVHPPAPNNAVPASVLNGGPLVDPRRQNVRTYHIPAKTIAPDAIQVADRWHIWHNLGEAVEAAVVAHRIRLPEPPAEPGEPAPPAEPDSPPQVPDPPTALQGKEIRLVTRTEERYRAVQQLLADGASRAEVGRRLGLDIQTVRRFADATSIEQLLANTRRESLIDPYKAHLHQRWNEGCTDTAMLHAEIREQGFHGSVQTLRRYLQPFRPIEDGARRHLRAPSAPPAPKPRRVAKWIMSDPAKIRPEDQQKLDAIRQRSPALDTLAGHVHDFADMMHKLRGDRLPQWIATVLAGDVTELHSFARGLQRDLAAATAGLTLPWSSGAVEGQVNRVKMLKRQMYGRARFDLLRRRILQPN